MEATRFVCDNCAKETKNWRKEKGWIRIDGTGLYVAGGSGKGSRKYEPAIEAKGRSFDFCSSTCLVEWLNKKDKL